MVSRDSKTGPWGISGPPLFPQNCLGAHQVPGTQGQGEDRPSLASLTASSCRGDNNRHIIVSETEAFKEEIQQREGEGAEGRGEGEGAALTEGPEGFSEKGASRMRGHQPWGTA